jgi:hypothetical protein
MTVLLSSLFGRDETPSLAEFCRALRVARCLAGIRAYTVADELDVSAAALSQWELNRGTARRCRRHAADGPVRYA